MPHISISANAFIKRLTSKSDLDSSDNYVVNEQVIIVQENIRNKTSIIRNIQFEQDVIFDNVDISDIVAFQDCTFKTLLQISNSKVSGFYSKEYNYSLVLRNCKANQLIIKNSKFERGLEIAEESEVKLFQVDTCEVQKNSIVISNSKIGIIKVTGLLMLGVGFTIEDSEITDYVRMASITSENGSLSFIKSNFKKGVYIWGGRVNSVIFNSGLFEDHVTLEAINNTGTLAFHEDTFKKSIKINNEDRPNNITGLHKVIYIDGIKTSGGLFANGANVHTTNLTIVCSTDQSGTLYFNSYSIGIAEITSDNHKGNFIFNYCIFEKIHFNNFNNYGNLTMSSCKALNRGKSEFILDNSNLGKAQFQNFFLNQFSAVSIIDSLVSSIEFSGMHWFNPDVLDVGDTTTPAKRTREVYRQLKQASEKQNDKFQALEFQALELKAYKTQVLESGNILGNDGMILWLAQTNDYGLSWKKPMVLVIIISTVFYFLIVISISPLLVWRPACNHDDLRATLREFEDFAYFWPQLFNPTRAIKTAFHKDVTLGFFAYFLDMIQRIILAFFVVQTVSAFRKFFKS